MPNEEEETIELKETFEKPRKKMSDKQLENLAKGRAARTKKVELSVEEKQNKRLEDRFDKLVAMFEKVQLPAPEVQEKVKARRAKPPPQTSDSEDEPPPPKPKRIEKKRPEVVVAPTRQVMFSFR